MTRPKILILGHGRHGKDTVAEIIHHQYGLNYISSSLFAASRVMMPYYASIGRPYASEAECFYDRANRRAEWHEQIAAYNTPDKSRLPREILEIGDMYVGMRCRHEYAASRYLFDAVCWVDATARRIPKEGKDSFNIDYRDNMWLINNDGDLSALERRVEDFMQFVEKTMLKDEVYA